MGLGGPLEPTLEVRLELRALAAGAQRGFEGLRDLAVGGGEAVGLAKQGPARGRGPPPSWRSPS